MKNENGFTLFELVVSIIIMGIMSLVAAGVIRVGIDSYSLFSSRSTIAREAQNTFRFMQQKIPMAIPSSILSYSSQRFRFADASGDLIDFDYDPSAGTLDYTINGSTRTILNNIVTFAFSYAKSDNTVWTASDPVSEINRVSLVMDLTLIGESELFTFYFTIRNE